MVLLKKRAKKCRRLIAFIAGMLLVASACSPEKHYNVLSIFFDGVPAPGEKPSEAKSKQEEVQNEAERAAFQQKLRTPENIYHPPYAERSCKDCHNENRMGTLNKKVPALCYECHDNFAEKYKYLHGPVDSGECTQCHNPHYAPFKKLTTRKGQELCTYCHELSEVKRNSIHSDLTEQDNCTDCHNPHGGNQKYFL